MISLLRFTAGLRPPKGHHGVWAADYKTKKNKILQVTTCKYPKNRIQSRKSKKD